MAETNAGTWPSYYRYWGKAKRSEDQPGDDYHLLPYHCLDVAAIAATWWDASACLRNAFIGHSGVEERIYRAWLLFFVASHDLGKWDVRFQRKALECWKVWNSSYEGRVPSTNDSRTYDHGKSGLYWFREDTLDDAVQPEYPDLFACLDGGQQLEKLAWYPWLEAVCGHHGYVISQQHLPGILLALTSEYQKLAEQDKQARHEWLAALAELFLKPQGLSLEDDPPECSPLLAGFCSVADWLGSDQRVFQFDSSVRELSGYFSEELLEKAREQVIRCGLISHIRPYEGVTALLAAGYAPHQLQCLVDQLPLESGLTVIEAPTGSGKTETALAYAWRLLDQGVADSIVFALPTQATANAMLDRLDKLIDKLFADGNLILAHGNSRFNRKYEAIRGKGKDYQGDEEAWAQCCDWLVQSRKRIFLGQIGVCTIDQVLISVLPVKHKFVRGFGVGRSVLIVDEVHAYDAYMYGLLEAVLKAQHAAGGSALLLSATLPSQLQQALLATYQQKIPSLTAYPLIAWAPVHSGVVKHFELTAAQYPATFPVFIDTCAVPDLFPDPLLLDEMVAAARNGAQVALVCNLVDVAQHIYRQLKERNLADIDLQLFHARFTQLDRRDKEQAVQDCFGREGDRSRGRILVATQVIEQSLDVDFDWLITQLCPVDLLFQRLGRLHRHKREFRPAGFSQPCATVLLPDGDGYGSHGCIYGNTLVMWRTEQLLRALGERPLLFPDAYRQCIESVYQPELTGDEPEWVALGLEKWQQENAVSRMSAQQMLKWAENTSLSDEDDMVRAVTRDGEMSLTVIPYLDYSSVRHLINGVIIETCDDHALAEALALNRVMVPNSWSNRLPAPVDDNGLYWLQMQWQNENLEGKGHKNTMFYYNNEYGLEKTK
jgi:CRISPR-associated endonuclease/helicase Cas3